MKLDIEKYRRVKALAESTSYEGERSAALSKLDAMANAAGMTRKEANRLASKVDDAPALRPTNIFEGFDDWMEEKEPGWKAKRAAKRSERDARNDIRRAQVLAHYGSEAALFALTEQEALLSEAIAPIATWEFWTDAGGEKHRYAAELDGQKGSFWSVEDITPRIRDAVTGAYPWPSTLDGALAEVKSWDRLRLDRSLFSGGEWTHYAQVECRIALLEHDLNNGRPAASWGDVQARFDWKRYEFERQWLDPTERDDPFLDRLEEDFRLLRASVQSGHRTTAGRRAAVVSMLDAHPDLSDREIARRVGVSPQTVGNIRRRRGREPTSS